MNSMHPKGIEMAISEWELRYELLRTWEEYYQLLLEIVNHLSPEAPQLQSDLPVTDLSEVHKVVVSRSAITSPHRNH